MEFEFCSLSADPCHGVVESSRTGCVVAARIEGDGVPFESFKSLGYESVAVTQKAYNGVAILSRHPMKTIAKALVGDDSDSHARFLEVIIRGIRVVNIYAPNGNPVWSDKFAYKLAWMDRL